MTAVAPKNAQDAVGRYRSYPRYKNPCVEWLGEIPEHWLVQRLKHCVARLESGGTPDSSNPDYWTDSKDGIPWVAISDMTRSYHVRETTRRITEAGRLSKGIAVLRAGTLLYSMYASLGKVALLDTNATINQAILGVVPRQNMVFRDYLRWWLEFMQVHVQMLSSSNTQDNLNAEKIRGMRVVLPPSIDEQRAIVAFLDRETARIDALIEKKRRQIELLHEKRAALISHAVTKGLDPNAPMKDSGIEGLAEIPVDWTLKRLKFMTPQITVGIVVTPSKYYVDEGIPCLRSLNVREDEIVDSNMVFISAESNDLLRKSKLREGDLVAVRTGQPGTTAVVDSRYDGTNCIDLIIVRRSRAFDSRFMCYVMNSSLAKSQYLAGTTGAIQEHFNIGTAGDLLVPIPPLIRQVEVRECLDNATRRISLLAEKIGVTIDRLREYRTALISAAVTGKIDVRVAGKEEEGAPV